MAPEEPPPREEQPTFTAAQPAAAEPWAPRPPAVEPVWQPAPTASRRPLVAVLVLSAVLVLVLVVAGLLLARMVTTTQAWEDSSAGWERLANKAATDLATTQSDLAAAQASLDTTTSQLATAQARITELANEKAQLGDTSATQQQLADYQSRVSSAAGEVATALTACIDSQQQLIGYLKEADQYDAGQLTQFGQDVQTLCGQATDANTALQAELKR
ncbi:hypothetical protein [Cellulomonas sp. URHD0024]|uniref:hypothetical protein n=1 Tax=Cellulomonas sp. URHD0024 TaxID=1302620 RepID=UPI001E2CFE82|nr:hypothetical protein [Cellulomonas sp. URHD0024]